MVAGLGCLFVAYIFNLDGARMALDGYLGGLDHSAKSHGPEVSRYGVLAFPYVAGALALAFVRILGGALVNTLAGLFRGSKKKAKPKPEQTAVPVQAVAAVAMPLPVAVIAAKPAAVVKPLAVCLKPPKPLRPERGVVKVAPAR